MGTTYYYTIEDEIIGEHTVGQSQLDYLPDALGSVVGTIDQSLTVQSTARFKPYGSGLAVTGTSVAFGWVGYLGYRLTPISYQSTYVRSRHLSPFAASWTTADSLWPTEPIYVYSLGNPTSYSDPSGNQPGQDRGPCCYEQINVYTPDTGLDPCPPTIYKTLRVKPKCAPIWAELAACSQDFTPAALCDMTGAKGDCCGAARSLGVDAACLCAVTVAENNFENRWETINHIYDGQTVGCIQMSVGTAKQALAALARCQPALLKRMFPRYPYSDAQIRNLLGNDCAWAMTVAAAYLRVNTDPKCNKGKQGTCANFMKLWNPSNPKETIMFGCTARAFAKVNPCT